MGKVVVIFPLFKVLYINFNFINFLQKISLPQPNPNCFIFQISWSKKNGLLDSGLKFLEGSIYTIHNISRHQAGVYKCQASNGVGYPVIQEIHLTVLCKYCF